MNRIDQYLIGLFGWRIHPDRWQLWDTLKCRNTHNTVWTCRWRPSEANAVANISNVVFAVFLCLDDRNVFPISFATSVEAVSVNGAIRQSLHVDTNTSAASIKGGVLIILVEGAIR
ncbi:hypothetical protein D3C77_346760 [compost metagenome]